MTGYEGTRDPHEAGWSVSATRPTAPRQHSRQMAHALRARLGLKTQVGAWSILGSPSVIDYIASTQPDFIGIDMQHAAYGAASETLQNCIRAADVWSVPVIVRVAWQAPEYISQALDAGAAGVIVPMVETAAEARQISSWMRFPPEGKRSWGGPVRAALGDVDYRPSSANDTALCLVMIESRDGLASAHEIASVPGIDGVYVGSTDLTISMTGGGLPSDEGSPADRLVAELVGALPPGIVLGTPVFSAEQFALRESQGFRFLPLSSDADMLTRGYRARVAEIVGGSL